jgi:hypothetical protein
MTNFVECTLCGKNYYYPERDRKADKALASAIGGEPSQTCDACSAIIVDGSPDKLDTLMKKNSPAQGTS